MKKIIFSIAIIIASAVIVVSFFKPWANVVTSALGVSKELTAATKDKLGDSSFGSKVSSTLQSITGFLSGVGDIKVKTTVTGYDIPVMVNSKTSKVAISLAQMMFKSAEGLEAKSYLVYLLPLSGMGCAVLVLLGVKKKIFIVAMAALSGAISITGLYNLKTADISTLAVKITVQDGLWYTMYGFLFIFVIAVAWLVLDNKR